jgi:hypothetical protein
VQQEQAAGEPADLHASVEAAVVQVERDWVQGAPVPVAAGGGERGDDAGGWSRALSGAW